MVSNGNWIRICKSPQDLLALITRFEALSGYLLCGYVDAKRSSFCLFRKGW